MFVLESCNSWPLKDHDFYFEFEISTEFNGSYENKWANNFFIGKEREDMRTQLESDTAMVLKQLEKDSNDIMNVIKKERGDRERDTNHLKGQIDNERKEMQILIDKDRDNFNNKLKDEHEQRRIGEFLCKYCPQEGACEIPVPKWSDWGDARD